MSELSLASSYLLTTIISIIGIIIAFIISLWKTISDTRREKPLIEKGQEAIKDRQEKLGLDGTIMPLYVDFEQLNSLYSQSKRNESPLQLESIKKSRNLESTAKIDPKIASYEGKISRGEEVVFTEYKNVENMYAKVLESLFDRGQLITELEKPDEADDFFDSEYEPSFKNKNQIEPVPQDIQEAMIRVRFWRKNMLLYKIGQLTDKIVIVKGTFAVGVCNEKQIDVAFKSRGLTFIARGFCEYRTKTGIATLSPEAQMKMSVFGYVSSIEGKDNSVIITPIAICRMLS